jgi:hypothetical protein
MIRRRRAPSATRIVSSRFGDDSLAPRSPHQSHLTLCLEPLVRVVLQPLLGQLPGHGLEDVLGLTGLEQIRDDRVDFMPMSASAAAAAERRPVRV